MSTPVIRCLFEQSGTFKKQFKALGYNAFDYDIANDFNETDHQIDLFQEIRGGYDGMKSLFDTFSSNDLVIAFFPCIRFEDQILLSFRGDQWQDKNLSTEFKLERDLRLMDELRDLYHLVTKLDLVCIRKNLKLILENPYSAQHFLRNYWALKPTIIDKNRAAHGDYFKKPTQYFFVNCEPKNELKPFIEYPKAKHSIEFITSKSLDLDRQVARSMIHPDYARWFIEHYLIDILECEPCLS